MSNQVRDAAARLPPLLDEVALVDDLTSAATGGMSRNWWKAEVVAGRGPQPALREVRCTRWRLIDVRNFWLERAARGSDPAVAERLKAQAGKASAAAKRKSAGGASEA